ncbi:MAG TPA: SOS response-associated peptidase [Chryseosolibacter sp.]
MIDRYSLTASSEVIRERFSVEVPEFYRPRFNAAPTQLLPVVTSTAASGVSLFYWGTSPEWSKNKVPSEKMINVRAESLNEKPALKKSLKKNRCLIPADGFYGWKKVGKKTSIPYRFVMTNKDLFAFAGLWEEFEDTDGHEIQTFMIFTQESNSLVAQIQERMPVILSRENEKLWLDPATDEESLTKMLFTPSSSPMIHYPVSPGISDIKIDLASLIIPTAPADQHGNLTLFD